MLTIKLITENTDAVIRGLEKKHFKGAKESIDKVLELNDKRRIAQNQLDKNLAEVNATSKSIGQLMKEGKKEEAEAAKKHVSEIKEVSKALQVEMDQAAEELQNLLYTIPNVPYDEVPRGYLCGGQCGRENGRYGNGTSEERSSALGIGEEI